MESSDEPSGGASAEIELGIRRQVKLDTPAAALLAFVPLSPPFQSASCRDTILNAHVRKERIKEEATRAALAASEANRTRQAQAVLATAYAGIRERQSGKLSFADLHLFEVAAFIWADRFLWRWVWYKVFFLPDIQRSIELVQDAKREFQADVEAKAIEKHRPGWQRLFKAVDVVLFILVKMLNLVTNFLIPALGMIIAAVWLILEFCIRAFFVLWLSEPAHKFRSTILCNIFFVSEQKALHEISLQRGLQYLDGPNR